MPRILWKAASIAFPLLRIQGEPELGETENRAPRENQPGKELKDARIHAAASEKGTSPGCMAPMQAYLLEASESGGQFGAASSLATCRDSRRRATVDSCGPAHEARSSSARVMT